MRKSYSNVTLVSLNLPGVAKFAKLRQCLTLITLRYLANIKHSIDFCAKKWSGTQLLFLWQLNIKDLPMTKIYAVIEKHAKL